MMAFRGEWQFYSTQKYPTLLFAMRQGFFFPDFSSVIRSVHRADCKYRKGIYSYDK